MRLNKDMADVYRNAADQFKVATGRTEYEALEVVRWAVARRLIEVSPEEIEDIHRERLAESLRLDVGSHNGQKVRLRHCCIVPTPSDDGKKLIQRTLWSHVDDATDDFLLTSLTQRRSQIQGDVNQLRADIDFINARRLQQNKRPIEMSFDFNQKPPEAASA
jgi:hypothetical protein